MASSRKKLPPRGFARLLGKDFLELSHETLEEAKGHSKKKSIAERSKNSVKEESDKPKRTKKEATSETKAKKTKATDEPKEKKITEKASASKKTKATTKAK